jgi:CubicO group peptidase (beta-lactamase class C family)
MTREILMTADGNNTINRREVLTWLAGIVCAPALRARTPTIPLLLPARHRQLGAPRDISVYLSRLEGFGFSGAVLVARGSRVLVQSVHGLADQGTHRRWQAETIFDVGSCTKQFTAAAILALEADGKLQASDPIAKYFTGVPADKDPITIHHLLTHTAGLPSEFGGDYEVISRDALTARALAAPLLSAPGEKHAYSNAGYSLLAAIVEIASGKEIDGFLRDRLFSRAGMASSGYRLSAPEFTRVARGYRDGEDAHLLERAEATQGQMWNLIGNGGLYSTIMDLHRWLLALQGDAVLPESSRQQLFHPHVLVASNYSGSGSALYYGYGWYIWKQPSGKTLIWHLGGNGITNTALRFHMDDKMWVVYASNVSEFHDPRYPVPAVERLLAGESVEFPPEVRPVAQNQLARFVGTYRAPDGSALTLNVQRNFLQVSGEGQNAFAFVVDGNWQSSADFDALNARTTQALEASRLGQFEVVAKYFGSWIAPDELAASEAAFWKKRHDRLGDYLRTRVLGTMKAASRRYVGRTIVAVDFSRGTTWREYFWTPEGLVGDVGPIEAPPTAQFFAVSTQSLVAFDPARARSAKLWLDSYRGEHILSLRVSESSVVLRRTS